MWFQDMKVRMSKSVSCEGCEVNHNCVFGWFPFFFPGGLPNRVVSGHSFDPFKSQRITWSQGWSVDQSNLFERIWRFQYWKCEKANAKIIFWGPRGIAVWPFCWYSESRMCWAHWSRCRSLECKNPWRSLCNMKSQNRIGVPGLAINGTCWNRPYQPSSEAQDDSFSWTFFSRMYSQGHFIQTLYGELEGMAS